MEELGRMREGSSRDWEGWTEVSEGVNDAKRLYGVQSERNTRSLDVDARD